MPFFSTVSKFLYALSKSIEGGIISSGPRLNDLTLFSAFTLLVLLLTMESCQNFTWLTNIFNSFIEI